MNPNSYFIFTSLNYPNSLLNPVTLNAVNFILCQLYSFPFCHKLCRQSTLKSFQYPLSSSSPQLQNTAVASSQSQSSSGVSLDSLSVSSSSIPAHGTSPAIAISRRLSQGASACCRVWNSHIVFYLFQSQFGFHFLHWLGDECSIKSTTWLLLLSKSLKQLQQNRWWCSHGWVTGKQRPLLHRRRIIGTGRIYVGCDGLMFCCRIGGGRWEGSDAVMG